VSANGNRYKTRMKSILLAVATSLLLAGCSTAQTNRNESFSNWPPGASPAEVGKRVAENFTARDFEFQSGKRQFVIYPEVIGWYGSLTVAKLTGDTNLQSRLVRKFDFFLTPEGAARISTNAHVDYRVFGAVPLELYLQTKQTNFLAIGKNLADAQWQNPTADGITAEARYWVDDMYMISAVQVQAFRATGDAKYLDRAALAMATYLDKLQQTNGLFFHAADSPFFWSRGNGWYAAGMAELLSELPVNHPKRARIMAGYKTMMASLLKFQSDEGRWRQLIDKPESWLESSGTGMFAFAMVTGVKRGWLDEKNYGPAARKAWLALVKNLDAVANVKDVCIGTNKGFQEVGADLDKQLAFYLARGRKTGDLHGQAPILWTASALLRN
jgi:rhamnogalacturonyl hydrolase YesR